MTAVFTSSMEGGTWEADSSPRGLQEVALASRGPQRLLDLSTDLHKKASGARAFLT